ncbi:MAG TPA: hypothetical protein VK530_10745 [Candidatus Acidoferrum sp.]|nr:hypothetical protein [Candidatus Acidoferrum sp.]
MNARILTLLTATLIMASATLRAGESFPSTSYAGSWGGYDEHRNAGATGGAINLTITAGESERFANISGIIEVPDLRRHPQPEVLGSLVVFREFTGRVNLRTGALNARFEGGRLRGRLDRNGHDLVGRVHAKSGPFQVYGGWFADEDGNTKGALD